MSFKALKHTCIVEKVQLHFEDDKL